MIVLVVRTVDYKILKPRLNASIRNFIVVHKIFKFAMPVLICRLKSSTGLFMISRKYNQLSFQPISPNHPGLEHRMHHPKLGMQKSNSIIVSFHLG